MPEKEFLYMKIYRQIRQMILEEQLLPGARLPSIRSYAAMHSVSRITVENAYLQLAADGYIAARPQSGYYVTEMGALRSSEPEKTEECLLRLVREQHRTWRAVTCRDYEELTKETPGLIIHSAHAWTEENNPKTIHIVVRPGSDDRTLPLTKGFRDNILAYLDERRILGTSIRLHSPEYIRVNVSCEVIPAPEYRDCEVLIEREFRRFFAEKNRLYGVPLEFSELYGRLDRLPFVRRISSLQMEADRPGVGRKRNGDLVPPPGGVFLMGDPVILLDHYRE